MLKIDWPFCVKNNNKWKCEHFCIFGFSSSLRAILSAIYIWKQILRSSLKPIDLYELETNSAHNRFLCQFFFFHLQIDLTSSILNEKSTCLLGCGRIVLNLSVPSTLQSSSPLRKRKFENKILTWAREMLFVGTLRRILVVSRHQSFVRKV